MAYRDDHPLAYSRWVDEDSARDGPHRRTNNDDIIVRQCHTVERVPLASSVAQHRYNHNIPIRLVEEWQTHFDSLRVPCVDYPNQ